MSTRKPVMSSRALTAEHGSIAAVEASFAEIVGLIEQARQRAYQAVNTELIGRYWQVGQYISAKLATAVWGELERQYRLGAFERAVLSPPKVSAALTQMQVSPALVAQYRTPLPDRQMLAAKLHEFYELSALEPDVAKAGVPREKPKGRTA